MRNERKKRNGEPGKIQKQGDGKGFLWTLQLKGKTGIARGKASGPRELGKKNGERGFFKNGRGPTNHGTAHVQSGSYSKEKKLKLERASQGGRRGERRKNGILTYSKRKTKKTVKTLNKGS